MDLALNNQQGWYAIKPNKPNERICFHLPRLRTYSDLHLIYIVSKVGDLGRGRPEEYLFESYYTEV